MWDLKPISGVTEIVSGGTPKSAIKEFWDGHVQWLTPKDMGKLTSETISATSRTISEEGLSKSSAKLVPANSVILSTRAPIGHLAINQVPMAFNQGCRGLVPNANLDTRFLYYFLMANVDHLNDLGTGTTFKELSRKALAGVKIPLPPIEEQKHIVAILDEAFASIDKAIANTEQNINQLGEFLRRALASAIKPNGYEVAQCKIADCFKLKSGNNLTQKMMKPGSFPVYGGNGIAGYHNEHNLSGKQVIIGRVGAWCGNVRFVDEPIWLTDNAFKVCDLKQDFYLPFLADLLASENLRDYARQAAQPVISNSSVKDIPLTFPINLEVQKAIHENIASIKEQAIQLEVRYQSKLGMLRELKQSLLQKAFSGELNTDLKEVA